MGVRGSLAHGGGGVTDSDGGALAVAMAVAGRRQTNECPQGVWMCTQPHARGPQVHSGGRTLRFACPVRVPPQTQGDGLRDYPGLYKSCLIPQRIGHCLLSGTAHSGEPLAQKWERPGLRFHIVIIVGQNSRSQAACAPRAPVLFMWFTRPDPECLSWLLPMKCCGDGLVTPFPHALKAALSRSSLGLSLSNTLPLSWVRAGAPCSIAQNERVSAIVVGPSLSRGTAHPSPHGVHGHTGVSLALWSVR